MKSAIKSVLFGLTGLSMSFIVSSPSTVQAATTENVITVKKPRTVVDDTSEANRMNKNFYLGLEPAGFATVPVPSAGVHAGYYLNSDLILWLEATGGSLNLQSSSSTVYSSVGTSYSESKFDLVTRSFGGGLKFFLGNSFYTKGLLDYRKIGINNFHTESSGSVTGSLVTSSSVGSRDLGYVSSLNATFAIGNQWQWENFTLGCDWLGISMPMQVVDKNHDTDGLSDSDREQVENAWNKLGEVTSLQLLRFYLGASF